MPPEIKKKQMNIEIIDPDTYEWLGEMANEQGTSTRRATNELLDMIRDRGKFLTQIFPDLTKIGFKDGYLFINDDKLEGVAKIGLDEKNFVHCQLCKKMDCIHVLYSMALIEVTRLAPFRKPK